MKVMLAPPQAHCAGCGCVLYHLGQPDRATGEFSAACGIAGCELSGVAVKLAAAIVDLPVAYPEWR